MLRDSPTRRVRTLADAGARQSVAHVGLAHEKLAPHNSSTDKEAQARFLRNLVDHSDAPPAYAAAFRRWVRRTPVQRTGLRGRRVRVAVSQGRVLCGLGELTPTENGLAIHHTYGVPYLPGSSLKGILKAYLEACNLPEDDPWSEGGRWFQATFGVGVGGGGDDDGGLAAMVSFLDALWVPGDPSLPAKPWAAEIVTPHFGSYYQGTADADGTQSPTPNTFLAAQGGYRVVVEGPQGLLDAVCALLEHALLERGIGAKSRAGYGRFVCWPPDQLTREDGFEEADRLEREAAMAVETAFLRASTATEVLDALLVEDPGRDPRADLTAWLTNADRCDPRLAAHLRDAASVAAVFDWAHRHGLSKGLLKKVRDALPPEILATLEGSGPEAETLPEPPRSGFGPNHLDEFDVPTGLSKGRRKRWPNDFAEFIKRGAFDSSTVHRAIAHLRAHGGGDGHVNKILREYGIDEGEGS